jgi:hypothetical protein
VVAGGGNFCEECGHPLGVPAPVGSSSGPVVASSARPWFAVVSTDRKLFDALGAAARGFVLPTVAERRVALTADRIRIGRSGRGGRAPDVDLCGPPPDPGVSREHAELLRRADGGWAVRDAGSANGTYLGSRRLAAGERAPVTAGEPVRLGVWSRITLVQDG